MAYDRYPRAGERGGSDNRNDLSDYGPDYGATNDPYSYSSARDYRAAEETRGGGQYGRDREDGRRSYGAQVYGQRERTDTGGWGNDRDDGRGQSQGYGRQDFAGGRDYYRPDQGSQRFAGDQGRDTYRQQRGTYDRQPQSYRDDDRGFIARAGDEVRSWFGDEEAERRREMDARDERTGFRASYGRDEHYTDWRNQQIAAFDRDYSEYRQENGSKFHNEFSSFRTERQSQRELLNKVEEHAEVLGSDGEHVGAVDKVRGDRILLTKTDADAGGRHHSIPSRWLQTADAGKVTLRKTAAEAKQHWRDEERAGAMFGDDARSRGDTGRGDTGRGDAGRSETGRANQDGADAAGTNLNRSFSGTY